jgi:hypothetical protein
MANSPGAPCSPSQVRANSRQFDGSATTLMEYTPYENTSSCATAGSRLRAATQTPGLNREIIRAVALASVS